MNITPKDTPALLHFVAYASGATPSIDCCSAVCSQVSSEIHNSGVMLRWGMYYIAKTREENGERVIIINTSTHGSAIGQKRAACIKRYFTEAGIPFITK